MFFLGKFSFKLRINIAKKNYFRKIIFVQNFSRIEFAKCPLDSNVWISFFLIFGVKQWKKFRPFFRFYKKIFDYFWFIFFSFFFSSLSFLLVTILYFNDQTIWKNQHQPTVLSTLKLNFCYFIYHYRFDNIAINLLSVWIKVL